MEVEKEELKRAIISGASHALKYRRERGMLTDEDVIQRITREAEEIMGKIDLEE